MYKRGGIKFLPCGALKIYTPTSLPWQMRQMPLARHGGRGGGRRVKQVRFGNLAFPQLNGAFFTQTKWHFSVVLHYAFSETGLETPHHPQNPSFCAEKRKKCFTEPNVGADHCSHKSGPKFFTENKEFFWAKNHRFLAKKLLHSAVRTPIWQIVPVSRVYKGGGSLCSDWTRAMHLLNEPDHGSSSATHGETSWKPLGRHLHKC